MWSGTVLSSFLLLFFSIVAKKVVYLGRYNKGLDRKNFNLIYLKSSQTVKRLLEEVD